jgi:hypothetical protein
MLYGCSSSQNLTNNIPSPLINNNSSNNSLENSNKNLTDKDIDINKNIKICSLVINKFSNKILCSYYSSKTYPECNNEIVNELVSRNLYSFNSDSCKFNKLIEPIFENKKCIVFIRKIINMPDPISKACMLRYKPNDSESIVCRKDLNNFINSNSNGIGTNLNNCGLE